MVKVAFIYPVIRDDYIYKSVESLYKYTDNFSLIIVDQSLNGLNREWCDKYVHLYLRQKNQGFSNAANKGIIHALRTNIPYITVVNDDTVMMYPNWFEDLLEEFKTDPNIIAVCPESPRIPLWGYGRPHEEYIDLIEYKENYTQDDIDFLKAGNYQSITDRYPIEPLELPIGDDGKAIWNGKIYVPIDRRDESPNKGKPVFPLEKRGVIDAIAMWMPVFKREALIEKGMFDERFVWGGGEDYELNTRAYSCAFPVDREECDERYHRRMVSTMKSWVWHWWGKSKDVKAELDPKLFEGKAPWNDINSIFPADLNGGKYSDPWGHWTDEKGVRRPFRRIAGVYVDELPSA